LKKNVQTPVKILQKKRTIQIEELLQTNSEPINYIVLAPVCVAFLVRLTKKAITELLERSRNDVCFPEKN